jgi:protocatechuate 3,4-dioxygenase beta subunit
MTAIIRPGRRAFLGSVGAGAFLATRGLFAEALAVTAKTTEGPYYPDKMPLDTDNDLLIINDAITPAVGEIAWLSGRLLTSSGEPVRNAFIEIWQCDARMSYLHTQGRNAQLDANFQGYGRYLTDSTGNYIFRTIRPVSYTLQGQFRAPHIHVAVSRNGKRTLTTQVGIRGHEDNPKDPVWKMLTPQGRETTETDFKAIPGSKIGELTAKFDIVLDRTAAEGDDGVLRGGIGPKEGLGPGLRRRMQGAGSGNK